MNLLFSLVLEELAEIQAQNLSEEATLAELSWILENEKHSLQLMKQRRVDLQKERDALKVERDLERKAELELAANK